MPSPPIRSQVLAGCLGAVLALVASGTAAAADAAVPAAGPQPKLVVAEPVHDLGIVAAAGKAEHTFVLRNDGDAPLEITAVNPDCGCTVSTFDRTIAPGATGKVSASVDLANVAGATVKRLQVVSNDSANPQVVLSLKFEVKPYIAARPGYARYLYVRGEVPGTISQTIWAEDFADLQVLSVDSPYPYLKTSFHEATPDERRADGKGRQWRVDMVLEPTAEVGPLAAHVTVETNHPRQKLVKIPVSGFVRPVVAVTPPQGALGQVDVSAENRKSLVVQAFSTEEVRVTKVESDIKGLRSEIKPVVEGRKYQVVISLDPQMAKGDFSGTVKIHTDSPKQPLLEVPLTGTVL